MKLRELWNVIETSDVIVSKIGYDDPVYGTCECNQPIEDFFEDEVVTVMPQNIYASLGETIPVISILID